MYNNICCISFIFFRVFQRQLFFSQSLRYSGLITRKKITYILKEIYNKVRKVCKLNIKTNNMYIYTYTNIYLFLLLNN